MRHVCSRIKQNTMKKQDFEFLRHLVQKESGISLSEDKMYLINARLKPVLERRNLNTIEDLIIRLRWLHGEDLVTEVINVLTIHETFFFRDDPPFNVLRDTILPEMVNTRSATKTINIWSAACSSGQEPYSIAMLICDHFPEMRDWKINILATDISEDILTKAKEGHYTQFEIERGLPDRMLKYFDKVEHGWNIKPEIKQMVNFQPGNLVQPWSSLMPAMDIIFMRNVLIYFEMDTKKQILSKVKQSLHHDGYLFLGQSETVSQLDSSFEPCHYSSSSCFRLAPLFNNHDHVTS